MRYNTDGSGQSRVFYKNGHNYKRDRVFRSERDAEEYVRMLKEERGSRRFEPYIERMRWNISNQGGLFSRLGFTRYRVYIPIQEK
jgi:hypothetical protein